MFLSAVTALAIVVSDRANLRAAPTPQAQQQAVLWQGDSVEVRGERLDYLQVYDHRRERAGYVVANSVRMISSTPEAAPDLLSVMRFLRDTPGSEALGIAYAAAYLRAATAGTLTAEPMDAISTMADRLANRASVPGSDGSKLSAQLEVASSYGIGWKSFEREGRIQTCYEGEAARQVLSMPSTPEQRARAALVLTRHECVDPALSPLDRQQANQWRADVLDRVDTTHLPELLKNRVRIRRAGVWATVAFEQTRKAKSPADAAERAMQELAAVNKQELTDADQLAYTESAVRVGASRWGAATVLAQETSIGIATTAGEPGQTCVLLTDAKHDASSPLLRRCTFGTVWPASVNVNPKGTVLTLAVQPLDTWCELWVFRRVGSNWALQVLPPAADRPDIGYVEFAGWVPGNDKQMLAAREVRVDGRWRRTFEVVRLSSLEPEVFADSPRRIGLFYRWQSPQWKSQTVSLR